MARGRVSSFIAGPLRRTCPWRSPAVLPVRVGGHDFSRLPLLERVEGFDGDGDRAATGLAERPRLIHARTAIERQAAPGLLQRMPSSAAYADEMT